MKSNLLAAIAMLVLATATMAQPVPSYIPTSGLVAWWPFTGNANDESGNGHTGIVNGPTLTTDRFSNSNHAYSFDGVNDTVIVANSSALNFSSGLGISFWINLPSYPSLGEIIVLSQQTNSGEIALGYNVAIASNGVLNFRIGNGSALTYSGVVDSPIGLNQWHHVVCQYQSGLQTVYIDSVLVGSVTQSIAVVGAPGIPLIFGNETWGASNANYFGGRLDDIAIWDRSLSQQEITDLFIALNCSNSLAITPQNNFLQTGSTATYTATNSDPNPIYVWQSDFGQGFQTLNNFGNYSGANTSSLNITNVQLSEHNQQIRVITTSGNCIDTSNVAVINILDTCITNVTVYDTLLTTVTDTLIINATIIGINSSNILNTLKVFPNPASTHITIDYGNFNAMSGYTLTIVNSDGQTVFTTPINQQTSYIDLSTWTGNGIYFVQLIDPQNNTIENRKIVIQ